MAAYDFGAPDTGTALATMDPNSVRKLWQDGIDVFEQTEDFFNPMCGGPSSIIQEQTKTAAGKGMGMTFTVGSGFYGEGKIGDDRFTAPTDYEEYQISSFQLFVDFVRHGERHSERMEELLGMRNEIATNFNVEQGKWMGRLKSHQLFMMFRNLVPADNIVYAGNQANRDALVSANTLSWDEVIKMGVIMEPLGGLAAKVGTKENGEPLFAQTIVASTQSLYSLDLDSNYKQLLRETRVEMEAAKLFDGGYAAPKGHVIAKYNPINHDGVGPIGSPLNPQAVLGVAITPGTTTFAVKGGGDATSAALTQFMYFKDFWNYSYPFIGSSDPTSGGSSLLAQDAGTHYFLIVNPSNAPTDPGKWCVYSYTTGNNGNQITIVNRLGAAASGARLTTLANWAWDGTVNTDTHPIGAKIYQCNAKCVPIGHTLMLGKRAAYRGWGKFRNKRYQQDHEGGFIMERYVGSVFGQCLRQDRRGRVPGVIRLTHAVQYPGVNLPIIT